ncbi:MAG: polymer-forming cytoskeletal protein [Thermoleophilia bacterium]|nr:polymer-forming cytoskeletal protein [Thermoleophilia bacterium]
MLANENRGSCLWRWMSASLAVVAVALSSPAAATAGEGEDAIVVVNGAVTVERGQVVDGVFVANGDVEVAGTVTGDVFVASGDLLVTGEVEGDVVALTGLTRVGPRAVVGGDLIYADEEPEVSPEATVGGEVRQEDWGEFIGALPLIGAVALWVGISISALILGVFAVMVAPRAADAVSEQARTRLVLCVAYGLAVFVGVPLAIVLASATLIGLPLGLALLLSLLPLAAIAYVSSAWALGRALVKDGSRVVAFLAGLAILRVLAILPLLGALVGFAAVIVGLGLLVGAIGADRRPA